MTALIIVAAILLDHLLGEPKRYHPLVGFGLLAQWFEKRLNCFYNIESYKFRSFFLGFFSWLVLVLIPAVFALLLVNLVSEMVLIAIDIAVLTLVIAPSSLRQHALAVLNPLLKSDVVLAREELAKIVSRDTQTLDAVSIRQATIESVLENGSDAVFAPLFWYLLGGLPAIIVYRLSNTLDAMWGYKTQRFNYFGRFSARMDDILNYILSRFVGLSYALLGQTRSAFSCWFKQANQLESPSAGVVMSAGAGALGLKLGGASYYHGKRKAKPDFGCGRLPENHDIQRSLGLISKTLLLWCFVITLVSLTGLNMASFNSVFESGLVR